MQTAILRITTNTANIQLNETHTCSDSISTCSEMIMGVVTQHWLCSSGHGYTINRQVMRFNGFR